MGPEAISKSRSQEPNKQKKRGQRLGAVRLSGDGSKENRTQGANAAPVRVSPPPELRASVSPERNLQALENRTPGRPVSSRSAGQQQQRDTPLHKHFTALLDTGKEAYNVMRQATVELTMGIDSMVEEAVQWAAPVLASPRAGERMAGADSAAAAAWERSFEDEDGWDEPQLEPRRQAGKEASSSNRNRSPDDVFASWGLDWPINAISPRKAPSRSSQAQQHAARDASTSQNRGVEDDCDLERPRPLARISDDLLRDELMRCKADLEAAWRRCDRLASENAALRSEKQSSPDPDPLAEQVRGQLQALLSEKAQLAQENARLQREVAGLQELLDYTMHPLESSDEEYPGGWYEEAPFLEGRMFRTRSCDSMFRD